MAYEGISSPADSPCKAQVERMVRRPAVVSAFARAGSDEGVVSQELQFRPTRPDGGELVWLPNDVLLLIFALLNAVDLGAVRASCASMRDVAADKHLWRDLLAADFPQTGRPVGALSRGASVWTSAASHWRGWEALPGPQLYGRAIAAAFAEFAEGVSSSFDAVKMASSSFVFGDAGGDDDELAAVPTSVGHKAAQKGLKELDRSLNKVVASLEAGNTNHALFALFGSTRAFAHALNHLRHAGRSENYWRTWGMALRRLCGVWVTALSRFEGVSPRLRDSFLKKLLPLLSWRATQTSAIDQQLQGCSAAVRGRVTNALVHQFDRTGVQWSLQEHVRLVVLNEGI